MFWLLLFVVADSMRDGDEARRDVESTPRFIDVPEMFVVDDGMLLNAYECCWLDESVANAGDDEQEESIDDAVK